MNPVIQVINCKKAKPRGVHTFYCGRGRSPHDWMEHANLGNRHDTGDRKIERFKEDWVKGELDDEFNALFQRWENLGFCKIALACWCIPEDCHAEVIRDILLAMHRNRHGQFLKPPQQ